MPWMLLGNPGTAGPTRSCSVKGGLTITRYWLARSASSAVAPMPVATRRRCPHYRWVDTADWPSTSGDIFRSLRAAENRCPATLSARLPWHGKHCRPCRRPPGSERRACGGASIAKGDAIQRMKTMASKQPRKQAKSAEKCDIGEANQPARGRQRTPRRRTLQARSKSTATQTGEAAALAAAASRSTSKSIGRSKNTTPPPEDPASQSDRIAEGVNLAMARMPDADRPRASTKRAVLIGMLERPEGASVAEIGQRLGWLPHTVRAAFTGLRHAGREVTRSKDAEGQSVYRLAPVETAPDR